MKEQRINEIIGMIEDKEDKDRTMYISDSKAIMGFYKWVRLDLVRETLREAADEQEATTKKDLGVDLISRNEVLNRLASIAKIKAKSDAQKSLMGRCMFMVERMPSVTPQEPQTFKWCTDCKEYDQEKHCCHRYSKVIRDTVEEMRQEYIEREVLDKIRAQIKSNLRGVEITLEVLNENHPLRPKMAGAKDTLKDCLELIDKAESEG